MLNNAPQIKTSPPKLIPSIVEGFNTIASRIYLILFPVVFDLILWFGPLLRVKNLLMPIMAEATELSGPAYGDQGVEIIKSSREMWATLLESFNLLFGFRTYPVGIPSLMISQGAQKNPVGALKILEIGSMDEAALIILGLLFSGIVAGSYYFALVAKAASQESAPLTLNRFFQTTGQSLALSLILAIGFIALGMPAICLISAIIFFLPALGILPFMILGMILVWVLLPLAFSPHGIFLGDLNASKSIITSVKLVRSLMTGAGMFFIMVILLGYGMDILWSTPGTDSWMMLVGIFGHGFISSGLLASTFVFYRDGVKWLGDVLAEKQAAPQKAES